MRLFFQFFLFFSVVFLASKPVAAFPDKVEKTPVEIPLSGLASVSEAEYSGLAWFQNTLILVPQYPALFGHHLITLEKKQILSYLDGAPESVLQWKKLPFEDGGLHRVIPGFEGYEALDFDGDTVYMTIEANGPGAMHCYLVRGQFVSPEAGIVLDPLSVVVLPVPAQLENMCHEALMVHRDQVLTFFEANGRFVNPEPFAYSYGMDLSLLPPLAMPFLEYRLTDVTCPDEEGRFWAMNFFFPGEAELLDPADDPLFARHGRGRTHAVRSPVERIVEFRILDDRVVLTDTPPVQLQLQDSYSHNWEGIVRLDDRGFLLVSDWYPLSILAFVPGN